MGKYSKLLGAADIMYPSSLQSEVQTANRVLAQLIYLSFALPEATFTHRVHRQLQPLLQRYPSSQSPFAYRAYTFQVEKQRRKVQNWYLNGLSGPSGVNELPMKVTAVGNRQSDEWRMFLASHALVRRIVEEDSRRDK